MKIYALQGKSNIGKTFTLKTAIYELLKRFDAELELYEKLKKDNSIKCVPLHKMMSADELKKQLEKEKAELEKFNTREGYAPNIKNIAGLVKINGKTIAVNVAGDNEEEIGLSIAFLTNIEIDVLICAVHTSGVTIEKLNEYCKSKGLMHGKDCFVIAKTYWNNYGKEIKVSPVIFDLCNLQAEWLVKTVIGLVE